MSLLGLLVLAACDEGTPGTVDGGTSDAGSRDGATGDGGDGTVTTRGMVRAWSEFSVPGDGIAGAEVCVDAGTCVTSASDGAYEIAVPASSNIVLRVVAPAAAPHLFPFVTTTATGTLDVYILDVTVLAAWLAAAGDAADSTAGLVFAQTSAVTGVTLAIDASPASRTRYLAEIGRPDAVGTETSTSGGAFIVGVTPSEHTVSATHATLTCTRALGWPGSSANAALVPVEAGALTWTSFRCM